PRSVETWFLPISLFAGIVRGTAGTAPPFTDQTQSFIAEWIGARSAGEAMGHQHMQAFDARRHATGGDTGDFGHGGNRFLIGQVCIMGPLIGIRQIWVVGEPPGHIAHHSLGFHPTDRPGQAGTRDVIQSGKRRAVVEPRTGVHHAGMTRRTARGHLQHATRRTTQLLSHHRKFSFVDGGVAHLSFNTLSASRDSRAGSLSASFTVPQSLAYHSRGLLPVGSASSGTSPSILPSTPITRYPTSPGITQ